MKLAFTSLTVSAGFELKLSVIRGAPGGCHLGTLPPAGDGESAGLDAGTEEDEGLLDTTFAIGGLLTGVVAAAIRQYSSLKSTLKNLKLLK